MFGLGRTIVADAGKFSGSRGVPPRRWKILGCDDFGRQIVRKFSRDQNQIRRRVVGVEMDELLGEGGGWVRGVVGETIPRPRPAPAVKISTFTIQWRARIQ